MAVSKKIVIMHAMGPNIVTCPEDASRLGPVKRQFLRGLIR